MTRAGAMRRETSGTPTSDPELLARIRDGELGALGELFDRHEDEVRRVVSRLGVSEGDVDDLVQATFLAVPRAAERYDGRDNARPWLIGLSVNEIRRHRRSLSRMATRLKNWALEPTQKVRTPEETSEESARVARASRALAALSEKKREVLVLITLEGLSGEEVARMLDIPIATVWTRLHHARKEMSAAVFEEES